MVNLSTRQDSIVFLLCLSSELSNIFVPIRGPFFSDVCAGAARIREGVRTRAHVETGYHQQSRHSLRQPGQDGGDRGDVRVGTARKGEGKRSGEHTEIL